MSATAPLRASIAHRTPRRLRLLVPKIEGDALRSTDLADRVALIEGVSHVVARPATASLIVECADSEAVLTAMQDDWLVRIGPPPKAVPLEVRLKFLALQIDSGFGAPLGRAGGLARQRGRSAVAGGCLPDVPG
ncbi:hypothetical protein [Breoghania sp.]|uniref:hypothetical protein n=1 Tax=Breoghania sp. TaxID=2065378 RepID=UPI00262E5B4B|nr:hypothetical protein [Breoghania sp.]MDJ0932965.1 hypothetical protein [Breoghania sp.]